MLMVTTPEQKELLEDARKKATELLGLIEQATPENVELIATVLFAFGQLVCTIGPKLTEDFLQAGVNTCKLISYVENHK